MRQKMCLGLGLLSIVGLLGAQATEESFKAYTDAPRLLLRPQRLRLLKRERERQSIRFQQFDSYVSNGAAMPENGFAYALAGRIYEKKEYCSAAAAWTLKAKTGDLRQRALVLDWCAEMLEPGVRETLAKRVEAEIPTLATSDTLPVTKLRDRVFAALALADLQPAASDKVMRETILYWRKNIGGRLREGKPVPKAELYPLMELLHAVRDNFDIDLRQESPQYFLDLPLVQMLGYYPAPYPGKENEYRVAFFNEDGDPDLTLAGMMRAAEFALVAYDNNAELAQSLQGWLLQDRYLLRGPQGTPYEFLWANPYQPGLTYHHLPNSYHDKGNGMLFLRSNWEEEARYMCYFDGKLQMFEEGARKLMRLTATTPPIEMGEATVLVGTKAMLKPIQFQLRGEIREGWYIVGLKPNALYDIEVDDEELDEARTDVGGVLSLEFKKTTAKVGVRVREAQFLSARGSL